MNKTWDDAAERFVRNNCEKMTDEELAEKLGRPLSAVRKKRQRMGLEKCSGRGISRLTGNKNGTRARPEPGPRPKHP